MNKISTTIFALLLWASSLISNAVAQDVKTSALWFQQGRLASAISVTNSSGATALPTAGFTAWVCNTGANDAYLAFGGSGITTTSTTGTWLKAGTCGTYELNPNPGTNYGYVAAITASSTTSLTVETGQGTPPAGLGSGGGSGGAVTQGTSPWVDNVTQWASGVLGVMANYGTSPGAVLVPGVNAFVTNTPAVTQSGTWTVQPGNTPNTTPWLFSQSQGGNTAVVKPASTTPLATDPAAVVAISPNSAGIGTSNVAGAAAPGFTQSVGCVNQTSYTSPGNGQLGPILCNGPYNGATGSAVPAWATYIAINSGGNLTGWDGALRAGSAFVGTVGGTGANPTSVLTRPGDTTAYAQNDLIASSTTAGSIVVPSFTATRIATGSSCITRMRLVTNKTSGWGAAQFLMELWTTAPTFTNGDNAAYAVATGAAGWIGSFTITLTQVADGAYGVAAPDVGNAVCYKLASGSSVFWSLKYLSAASLTPANAQTLTAIPELQED